jgi:hypothetical protein
MPLLAGREGAFCVLTSSSRSLFIFGGLKHLTRRNSLNLSQLCRRKLPPRGSPAMFDRMSKPPQLPVYSEVPDPSSGAPARYSASGLGKLRYNFSFLMALRQKCPASIVTFLDFFKGAGCPCFGSKPAPFAFYACALRSCLALLFPYPSSLLYYGKSMLGAHFNGTDC